MDNIDNIPIKTEPPEEEANDGHIEGSSIVAQCKDEPDVPVTAVKQEGEEGNYISSSEVNIQELPVSLPNTLQCNKSPSECKNVKHKEEVCRLSAPKWDGLKVSDVTSLLDNVSENIVDNKSDEYKNTTEDNMELVGEYVNDSKDNWIDNYISTKKTEYSSVLNSERIYKCMQCMFYTKHQKNLTIHLRNSHNNSIELNDNIKLGFEVQELTTNLHKCAYCSFTSLAKKFIKDHVIKSHPNEHGYILCTLCGKHFQDRRTKKRHIILMHTETTTYKCSICEFSTIHQRSLKEHTQNHFVARLTQLCHFCGYLCTKRTVLDKHIRLHLKNKRYCCSICDYKSHTSSGLSEHLLVHSTERPFTCDQCSYKAKSKEYLKNHQETHMMDKPIGCEVCNYRCVKPHQLKCHMKVHDFNPKTRLHECHKCHKQFTAKQSLNIHLRYHDVRFKCQFCSFTTNRQPTLLSHEQRHTGLHKMYCYRCSYSTTHRANFTQHVNATCFKLNKKQYMKYYCYYCGIGFNHRSNFAKHVNESCSKLREMCKPKKEK